MTKSICAAVLVLGCGLAVADTLAERWSKRLESADAIFQTAIKKAEDTKFIAVKKATLDRVRVLKSAISDATKSGDFTAATELQSRLEAAEADGAVRPKPKNTVKFGGHEYALIEETVTFQVAKKRCEELGGHLVTFDVPGEQNFCLTACRSAKSPAWIGVSNEEDFDRFTWVTGKPAVVDPAWIFDNGKEREFSIGLAFWPASGTFNDHNLGGHLFYICEWDN